MSGKIEDIILRHSGRGMDTLRGYLAPDYAKQAAQEILSWERGTVLLTTGFYVAGYAETDGPVGTLVLAKALDALGFAPVIATDAYCRGFFEPEGIPVVYMEITDDAKKQEQQADEILDGKKPVGMISVERCGINTRQDFENMRGISIKEHTARTDLLFLKAPERHIPTIGVGDGGNEIGMGNLQEIIRDKLSLVPCAVPCDHLVIASVSNWGAYGITAWLARLTGTPVFPAYEAVNDFIEKTVGIGSVDGVTHERVPHVDGFSQDVEREIVEALQETVAEN